jgi:hypothetical protein
VNPPADRDALERALRELVQEAAAALDWLEAADWHGVALELRAARTTLLEALGLLDEAPA